MWQKLSTRKKWLIGAVIVLPLIAITLFEGEGRRLSARRNAAPLATAAMDDRSVELRVQISPRHYTLLTTEVGAKVSKLPVREGETFKEGALLVALDCSTYQAQLDKAAAANAAAQRTAATNKRLYQLNNIGRLEYENSQSEADKAKAEVAGLKAVVEKCTLTAPFAGRVNEQRVREEQYVQAGSPLMEILDDSVLELEFIAPSDVLAWLTVGYPFTLTLDETKKSYPAHVTRIGAKIDPISQSIKLAGTVDGTYPELLAGMSGKARFEKPPAVPAITPNDPASTTPSVKSAS